MGGKKKSKKRLSNKVQSKVTSKPIQNNWRVLLFMPLIRRLWSLLSSVKKRIGKTFAFVVIAIGLIGGLASIATLYFFKPHISVHVGRELNPGDVLSCTFEITNDGPVPVQSLKYIGGINEIIDKQNRHLSNFGVEIIPNSIPKLDRGETTTILFPLNIVIGPVVKADVEIILKFRYWWGREGEESYRFLAIASGDGKLSWMPFAKSQQ